MLVFIHGMWASPEIWEPIVKYFDCRGFKCKCLDLQIANKINASFYDYLKVVEENVKKGDIVIGHSLGGLLMQKVAEEKEIKAGIAICSAPPKGIKFGKRAMIASLRYFPKIISKKPFKPDFSFARKYIFNCIDEEKAREIYEKTRSDSSQVAYEIAMNKIAVDENKIKCPMLFIAMKNDRLSPPDMVTKIANKYGGKLLVYEGCHWFLEKWEEVADGIKNFIIENF
ncbi:MAG: alpha/beta hydrolase [Thermoplasmatales archaeon]|nr:alpha/beta hydrolase [Thermoplasmatales archaeon]